MQKKPIPHINVPIMTKNGSMELAWYLYLQWLVEGGAATISVDSTETSQPGSDAEVTNVGTDKDVKLKFVIPRGEQGPQGEEGSAATISVGTVTTGLPTDPASVTNSGTFSAAVFDFVIPQGAQGPAGPGVWGTIGGTLSNQTDLQNALNNKANDNEVVHIAGYQDITGNKNFLGGIGIKKTDDDWAYTPAEQVDHTIGITDKNGVWLGGWESYHDTNGNYTKQIAVRQQNGDTYATMGIGIDPNGNAYTWCQGCEANNSILTAVQTVRNQYSGYVKLGNGVLIQWGSWYIGSAGTTVTLPTAFVNNTYIIGASTETSQMGNVACYNKTTTTFQAWTSDDETFNPAQLNYIAIGSWY